LVDDGGVEESDSGAEEEMSASEEGSDEPGDEEEPEEDSSEEEAEAPPPAATRVREAYALPAPRPKGQAAPVLLALGEIDDDTPFKLREEGDLSKLATDLARLGQLFPIDVRRSSSEQDRYELVCGFRRVAALKFLQRDRVLARVHTDLSDDDALVMSLASVIHAEPVSAEHLKVIQARLEDEGRLTALVRDMLDKALLTEDPLAPETVGGEEEDEGEEVDADELAADVTERLGEINQDLALLVDVFSSLDDKQKEELLTQLRYSSQLVEYLEDES
jgi:ParB family transcriptional regulator, chromosome partitioning protein